MERLPNLFLAGFQKSATTSLFQSLVAHPEIAGPSRCTGIGSEIFPKEIHFFNLHFDRGLADYASFYEGVEGKYLIDGSPNYLCSSKSMMRLRDLIDEPTFIVSLRDPIDRIYSAWNHWQQLPPESRWAIPCPSGGLRENVAAEIARLDPDNPLDGFVGTGFYAAHIARALTLFPKERFFFTFSEWLVDGYQSEIQRAFRFLGLSPRVAPVSRAHVRNSAAVARETELVNLLHEVYREDGEKLRDLLGVELPWRT